MNDKSETPDSDDQDLTRLFDAQQGGPPEELDGFILHAAKEAVAQPSATEQKRRGATIKGWFAVAATLVLGVLIAPLLLQAPESALDDTATLGSTLEAMEESVSMAAEPSMRDMLDSESDMVHSATQSEAPLSVSGPLLTAIQTQSRKAGTRVSTQAQTTEVAEGKEYRRSPEGWLEHIRLLKKNKSSIRARTEYALFRQAFPDFAPHFTLHGTSE